MKLLSTILVVFQLFSPLHLSSLTGSSQPPLEAQRSAYYKYISSQTSADNALSTIQALCSRDFAGRQSGTTECENSAEWISQYMKDLSLQPCQMDEPGSYFQAFSVPYVQIENPTTCILHGTPTKEFLYRNEFYPYLKSDSGSHVSDGVFAGFGIATTEYNDYGDIDVQDKVVVVLSGKPSFLSALPYDYSNIQHKIGTAKKKGAKAILIINQNAESTVVNWEKKEVYDPGTIPSILSGFLSLNAGETILEPYSYSTKTIVDTIESNRKPVSFVIHESIEISITVKKETRTTTNVIGFIPSQNPTLESFLITAHYDHLGQDSINKDYYFGANDNASGVSVMVEIAKTLQEQLFTTDMHIVFIAFSGEEEGLIGSKWYVNNPLFPLEKIAGVINLDMVGVGDTALIAGTDDSFYPDLCNRIQEASDELGIPIEFIAGGLWSGSDQYFFHKNNVPCVFFWRSGKNVWDTYHTPKDVPTLIVKENLQEILQISTYTALSIIHPDNVSIPYHPLGKVPLEYPLYSINQKDFSLLSHYFGYQFES
jgi:hypothetical protein